jgi:hypothetical protein
VQISTEVLGNARLEHGRRVIERRVYLYLAGEIEIRPELPLMMRSRRTGAKLIGADVAGIGTRLDAQPVIAPGQPPPACGIPGYGEFGAVGFAVALIPDIHYKRSTDRTRSV